MERNRFVREGQQIGDYRLLRGLGKGGFGDVYLGEHIREHTQVAVKILGSRLARSEELKEFINEARTIRLKHPHIMPLLDFGIGSDDVPFLVMEYAPYGSLRDRYPKGSRLPLSTIISYVTPIASALQYAHDQHLIHRDVKPENMLVGPHQEVLLTDFGIVTVVHSSHSLITNRGMGGTLPYMAPEQIQGKPRPASDQYALGVVVYEWLCGRWPFNGTSIELLAMHQKAVPPSLREQVPILTVEVEQVVLRALAKDPKQRFARIQDFAEALEAARLSADSSSSIHPFDVPPVLPLPVEKTKQLVERVDAETAFPLPSPVLESRPLVTHSGEQIPEYVASGGTSPIVPVNKIEYSIPQRETAPQSTYRNRFSPGRTAVLIGLVLLIIAGSVGVALTTISRSLTSAQVTVTTSVQNRATATMKASLKATVTSAIGAYDTAITANGIMFGFDPQHTHMNPYEHILNSVNIVGLVQGWTYSTEGLIDSSPAIADGIIYFGSDDGTLYALDARSGAKKWTYSTRSSIGSSSPAIANGVVYFGSDDGTFYALDAKSGAKLWTYSTKNLIDSSPAIADGIIYFGSDDGTLYALDARSGAKKWTYSTGRYSIRSSPAVADGVVYFGTYGAILYALNAKSGTKLWAYAPGSGGYAGDYINSSPVVVNRIVYADWHDGGLYALDARSGTKLWTYSPDNPIDTSPAIANGIVYIDDQHSTLYALDARSGTKLWTYTTTEPFSSIDTDTSPAIANGVIYFGAYNGTLYALDARSGTKLWANSTGKSSTISTSPAVANGMVYVGSSTIAFPTFGTSTSTGSNSVTLYAFHLPNITP